MVHVPIYMDNHATTRVDPGVLDVMLPFFTEKYGNAASVTHCFGWEAGEAVEAAREQVAASLETDARSLIFTSGASEANNLAIKGVMQAAGKEGHLIVNAAEHKSVLASAKKLSRSGYEVTILPVDQYGMVDPRQVADAIQKNTILVSVMAANNEVGTLNPISEISRLCRERGVLFHTDAAQYVGKLPLDLGNLPVDLLSFTGHKMYGPKGVGALFVRQDGPRIRIEPLFDGGGHERHLRSGTLPVPLIVGFGRACALAGEKLEEESARLLQLRERLWRGLQEQIVGIHLNGHPQHRLPGNLNVSFENVDGEALMTGIKDVAVSSGSACTSADPQPSHVLRAMGVSDALTRSSLRFGLGRFNTEAEVDFTIDTITTAITALQKSH